MKNFSRKGCTLVEVFVLLVSVTVLLAITSLGVASGHAPQTLARSLRDGTQLSEVHKAFMIFARQFPHNFPTPGLIDRHPVDVGGQSREIPGRGEEDLSVNTTANLYSAMIMQNYFDTEIIISPVERNPHVKQYEDFQYVKYSPVEDTYWDDGFVANLAELSHASYAHLPMFGERKKRQWRETMDAKYIVLGNRGPAEGELDFSSHTTDPHGYWSGNAVYNDNHVELHRTMTPEQVKPRVIDEEEKPDNIFAMEDGPEGTDVAIAFTLEMAERGPVLQYD